LKNAEAIKSISLDIHEHPELGSQERRSSKLLADKLESAGFDVERGFMGMDTSFLARYGNGSKKVAVLAEYDALPIGHACGHNIIGAWAMGVGLSLVNELGDATLYVVGTPAEEGLGKYAASKVLIAPQLLKMGVSAVFAVHPGGEWMVGANLLGVSRYSYVFKGRDAHAAASPEKGINALDAAVDFYIALRMMHGLLDRKHQFVLSAIIKDGGTAPNVIPGRAEVWADIRADEESYLDDLIGKVNDRARAAAAINGCGIDIAQITPKISPFKRNEALDDVYYAAAKKYLGDSLISVSEAYSRIPEASSDVGNVSQVVPTSHLTIKIGPKGIPAHSLEFLRAAGSQEAMEALITAVAIGHDAVLNFVRGQLRTGALSVFRKPICGKTWYSMVQDDNLEKVQIAVDRWREKDGANRCLNRRIRGVWRGLQKLLSRDWSKRGRNGGC